MLYRLVSQARIQLASDPPSNDAQDPICIRPNFAERPDLQFRFAAWLVLLQIAIDCEMRYRYGIAAIDVLRAGIKLQPFLSFSACFQLVVTDLQSGVRSIACE